jgi:hypothetical protein
MAEASAAVNLVQALIGFAASAVGAALAGYFGVLFGAKKLRTERAFDRRLEWYESARQHVHEMSEFFGSLATFADLGKPKLDPDGTQKEWEKHALNLISIADGAEAYATTTTVREAWRAHSRIFSSYCNLEKRVELLRFAREAEESLEPLRDALISETRQHLGLEPQEFDTRAARMRLLIDINAEKPASNGVRADP